jgi:RNA polymerase sigma-70 factor (ECF subfamily)
VGALRVNGRDAGWRAVEAERVRAAQAGDALAMDELLVALADYVGRLCGPVALDDGPDAAQETLVQVFRDLRTLRDPGALRAWVRRIALREAVRHAQRSRREPAVDPTHGPELRELPAAGDPELARDVRSVLAGLSPDQRAVLVLRDLEGYSELEAADELRVAQGTVKSRLHRARAAFLERWSR